MSDIDWAERAKMLEDMDTIDKLVTKIERLTRQCTYKDKVIEQRNAMCLRAEARVKALEKVRVAVLKHRDNKEFLNMDTWRACVYAAEAATEQEHCDE